jgi:hypothetical protein
MELAAERALPSGATGPWDFFPLAREAARRRLRDDMWWVLLGRRDFAAGLSLDWRDRDFEERRRDLVDYRGNISPHST